MNFKLTKAKGIWSVVILIIINFSFWAWASTNSCFGAEVCSFDIGTTLSGMFQPIGLLMLLGTLIITYIILSLFQKK